MLKYRISNGCGISLWYDNWHPLGPFLEEFEPRVIYDSTLYLKSKVSDTIEGDEWKWPLTNTLELMEIREHMVHLSLPSSNNDKIVWVPSPNGKYSIIHT